MMAGEKLGFFIWRHTEHFIFLTEDVKSQERRGEKRGNILLKKMIHGLEAEQLMSQLCTVGVFWGVFVESVHQ